MGLLGNFLVEPKIKIMFHVFQYGGGGSEFLYTYIYIFSWTWKNSEIFLSIWAVGSLPAGTLELGKIPILSLIEALSWKNFERGLEARLETHETWSLFFAWLINRREVEMREKQMERKRERMIFLELKSSCSRASTASDILNQIVNDKGSACYRDRIFDWMSPL